MLLLQVLNIDLIYVYKEIYVYKDVYNIRLWTSTTVYYVIVCFILLNKDMYH